MPQTLTRGLSGPGVPAAGRMGRFGFACMRPSASSVLPALVVLGVTLRLVSAFLQGDVVRTLPGIYDQVSYDALARRVLEGAGFTVSTLSWPLTRAGEPTAHWSYLYTLFLTGVYALFGEHPLAARLIQALVAGILYPVLALRVTTAAFGVPAGRVAAGLIAVYGYFVYYAGALMTETFYILSILWVLHLAIGLGTAPVAGRISQQHGWRTAVLQAGPWVRLGLALGMAALLRQVILLCVPLVFVWILWARGRATRFDATRLRRTLGGLVTATAVVVALIIPCTVHNYQAFGRFVPLNTNAGFALFWGNHPIYGTEFVPILAPGQYQALVPVELRTLDEAALDQALLQRAVRFIVDDPQRYVLLSVSRVKSYFEFWYSSDSSLASNLTRMLSFGMLVPFSLYGLFLWARGGSSTPLGRGPAALLLVFASAYTLLHLLSWALIRYRLPVDAILIPFASLAVVHVTQSIVNAVRTRQTVYANRTAVSAAWRSK